MRQKKHNDKTRNIGYIKSNQTAHSAIYKRIKRSTKDYQKNNYDNQTNNKDNNRVTDMSIGLGEEKKSKPKKMDQKEEKPSSPLPTSSSSLQPEVFDSSRDNAMSEMKEVADMGPVNTSKVFSHVEEKQQLDPSTISINDSVKKTDLENSPNTNPDPTRLSSTADPTLEERDRNGMEPKEEDVVSNQDVKPDITQVHKESEKQDNLGESVRFHDNENKESHSNSLNNDKNNNPFISGIKLWQAY
ncbi:MAG: hypothetical protein WBQ25_09715, partial [Nitrososphaeraceae archaeon]